MKLLVVTPTFPPMRSGGAEFAFRQCEHLATRGVAVEVITSAIPDVIKHDRFVVHPCMHDWSWRELPRLLASIRRSQPNAVEIHFAGSIYHHRQMVSFLPAILRRYFPGIRVVLLVEYPEPIAGRQRSLASRLLRQLFALHFGSASLSHEYGSLLRDSDQIIILCEPHRARLARYDATTASKCEVIAAPPSISIVKESADRSARRRSELGIGAGQSLLVYYGYVYPNKGIETLLKAVQRLVAAGQDVRLLILGDANEVVLTSWGRPDYLHELRRMAGELKVSEKITWTGYFPTESTRPSELLRAADVCVLPFDEGVSIHRSTFGVAASHGLPIVTTRGKELESPFIDRENVLLCLPCDPEALTAAITEVITDPCLRQRLRSGVVELAAEHYSWGKCIDRTLEVLQPSLATSR